MKTGQSPTSAYWRRNLRLVAGLLIVWFLVSYGAGILFVEPLNSLTIAHFPLGFWFAHQGAIAVFILIIAVYCVRMDRLDAAFRQPGEPSVADTPDIPTSGSAE